MYVFFKILGTLKEVYKLCEVCELRRVGVCGVCVLLWCKVEEKGQESVLSLDLWPKGLNDNSVFMYFTF